MPFNLELTISGLCVIVLRSQDGDRPASPESVDVLCVGGAQHEHDHHADPLHRPRLSYPPGEVSASKDIQPDLVVDPRGVRSASLDLTGMVAALTFQEGLHDQFALRWGDEGSSSPLDEGMMNWVPTAGDVGFPGIQVGEAGKDIPQGAITRLSLQPGKLECRNVIRNPLSDVYFLWDFHATGIKRALANEVVYRAEGITDLKITAKDHGQLLYANKSEGTLYMAISNDLSKVPPDYLSGSAALDHLKHLQAMASAPVAFEAPVVASTQRTGHPICNQVLYVEKIGVP